MLRLVLFSCFALTPAALTAQSGAVLQGRVIDAETAAPVVAAFVSLAGADRGVLTDSLGFFALPVRRAPSYQVRVTQLGYSRLDVTLPPEAETREFTVRLPMDPIAIRGLTVLTERLADRRRGPFGIADVVTRDQLLRAPDASGYEFVRRRLPFVEACSFDTEALCMSGRSVMGDRRAVRVCVDGRRVPPDLMQTVLSTIDPRAMYLVEVYTRVGEVRMYSTGYMQRLLEQGQELPPLTFGCSDAAM